MKEQFFQLLPFLILANVFVIILQYLSFDNTQLMTLIPLFFLANLILVVFCFAVDFRKIVSVFKDVKKRTWIFLLLIFILALLVRLHAPATHRILFDEDIYLNVAQSIVNDGRAMLCNRGTPDACEEGVLNKQPQGLPFFLSIIFFFTGVSETIARHVMILISALSAVLLFLFVYLLLDKEEQGLYAALALALTPVHVLWAPTMAAETLLAFFAILSLTSILVYFRNRSTATALLLFSLLAYASQLRPEAPILALVAALFFVKAKLNKSLLLGFVLFLVFFSPYALQFKNVSGEKWGAPDEKLSLKYLVPNAKINAVFFVENTRYPLLFTVLALFGAVFLFAKKKYGPLSLLLSWFAVFFLMYALFYAGSFNFGVDVRYSIPMYAALSSLVGIGAYAIREVLSKKGIKFASVVVTAVILLAFYAFIPYVSAVGEESWISRTSHDFGIAAAKKAGEQCHVFTHVPSMYLVNNIGALQTRMGSNSDIVEALFKKSDCILFDEGYWCITVDRYKDGVCQHMHDQYNLTVFNSVTERDKTFRMYRVGKR